MAGDNYGTWIKVSVAPCAPFCLHYHEQCQAEPGEKCVPKQELGNERKEP
jgi:hypothetical protein